MKNENDKLFIIPQIGFCFSTFYDDSIIVFIFIINYKQTKNNKSNRKLFVNMCSSEKIILPQDLKGNTISENSTETDSIIIIKQI